MIYGESERGPMDSPGSEGLTPLRKFNLIFRFSYTLPFVLASVCGVVCAIPHGAPVHVLVLIPVVVLILALFVNFSNDYFDHMSGIDKEVFDQRFRTQQNLMSSESLKKLYWEGNQFDTGLVTERQGRAIMVALVVIALIPALPVIVYSGWHAVVPGIIGTLLAFFYTAPPVNFGARGLGEVTVAISFFLMVLCSFYVASGTVTMEIALLSTMVGLVVGLMRLVDSMSANDAHLKMGEINLSIRLGTEGTVRAIKAIVAVAYILAAAMCLVNILDVILFLTLPLTVRMVRTMNARAEHWDVAIIPYSFGFSVLTEVLFIIASAVTLAIGPICLI